MRLATWRAAAGSLFLTAVLFVPAWSANSANTDNRHSAVPGTLNYVEGQANMGKQNLDPQAIGSAERKAGQSLNTQWQG